jgi:hypothetical protein
MITTPIAMAICIRLFNANGWGTSLIPVVLFPELVPNSTAALTIEANPLKVKLFRFLFCLLRKYLFLLTWQKPQFHQHYQSNYTNHKHTLLTEQTVLELIAQSNNIRYLSKIFKVKSKQVDEKNIPEFG